ncbi:uncharacterized protein BKA78DRAFT_351036 [Phyllosticta capitalensis]|uniref:uncharacterized protein n=1 Tax=Phyllosticta capitalensis TaxID=121624 RepID=UPI00312EA61E
MSFQLFPAPPKKTKKQPIIAQSPASPEPAVELAERAKAPGELHELIIKINSDPTEQIQLPGQAHTTDTKTYQAIAPADGGRQRQSVETSCTSTSGRNRSQSNATLSSRTFSPKSASSSSSKVDPRTHGSPALSESATLIGTLNNSSPPVMRSIFPRYNPNLRLSQQAYKPTQPSPTHIPKEKISKSPYSPEFYIPHGKWTRSESPDAPYYTPLFELIHLWNAANNKLDQEAKRTFSLQLHNGGSKERDLDKSLAGQHMVFGTSPVKPVYMLQQSPAPAEGEQQQLARHEVLISRHHPTKAETPALPVAHLELKTPPPHREFPDTHVEDTSAIQVASIHSKLAALSALEAAANSPEAAKIALVDPTASSPEAAQLAAAAVAGSEAKFGCQLFFCPISERLMEPYETNKSATYELRHPQIGALPVVVQGGIKDSLQNLWESEKPQEGSRSGSPNYYRPLPPIHNTISLLNPFATPRSSFSEPSKPKPSSPSQKTAGSNQPQRPLSPAPDEIFVRLDLTTHTLTIDAAALMAVASTKGGDAHKYVIDTAVSAVLAVAMAESRREGHFAPLSRTSSKSSSTKEEQGIGGGKLPWVDSEGNFAFAGPPTTAAKERSKVKAKWGFGERVRGSTKGAQKQGDLEAGTAASDAGQVNGKKKDELPFLAELILWVLESAFKVVVFVLGLLLRIVAKVVVGACKCIAKA